MEATVTQVDGTSIISVPDNLDVLTSTDFKNILTEVISEAEKTELDFSKTELVSSAGLRVLLQAEKTVQKAEKIMTFKNVSPEVMEIFEMTGVSKIFTII